MSINSIKTIERVLAEIQSSVKKTFPKQNIDIIHIIIIITIEYKIFMLTPFITERFVIIIGKINKFK